LAVVSNAPLLKRLTRAKLLPLARFIWKGWPLVLTILPLAMLSTLVALPL